MVMVGCQKELPPMSNADGGPIYLSASTERTITRVPYEQTTPNATPEGMLSAAIWASSDNDSFQNSNKNGRYEDGGTIYVDGEVAIHTTANFVSEKPQLLTAAVYPTNGQTVNFVGLYPKTGWGNNGSDTQVITSANFTFDGSQDVMFAPKVAGQYDSDNTGTNENIVDLKFYHLLTWLKIKIFAENQEAKTAWGRVKSITIRSKNKAIVNVVGGDATNATFESTEGEYISMPLYRTGSNNVLASETNPYSLNDTPQEVAYVLCAPVEAKDKVVEDEGASEEVWVEVPEYTLDIVTENRQVVLPIDLRKNQNEYFTGSTRAKCFTLNLNFKMGNSIVVTATVDDWVYGGTGNFEF